MRAHKRSLFAQGDPGRCFEEEILGPEPVAFAAEWHPHVPQISFADALEDALDSDFQKSIGTNETCPTTTKGFQLYLEIQEKLKLSGFDASKLRLFPTLGTALDIWHGTDFVLCYEGLVVSIDLTTGRKEDKPSEDDTHLVLRPSDFSDLYAIQQAGRRIAAILERQIRDQRRLAQTTAPSRMSTGRRPHS